MKGKRGDTLIEVMLSVGIFGLASIGAISLMNRGLTTAQNSLEITMARQEIDTQAEALRFIHDAYLTEPIPDDTADEDLDCNNNVDSYRTLWKCIVRQAYESDPTNGPAKLLSEDSNFYTREVTPGQTCNDLFTTASSGGAFAIPSQSFIINPRLLSNYSITTTSDGVTKNVPDFTGTLVTQSSIDPDRFRLSGTYPRLIYGPSLTSDSEEEINRRTGQQSTLSDYVSGYKNKYLKNAEGIWITAIESSSTLTCSNEEVGTKPRPDFYDFKIQTCWDAPGGSSASVISSTIRLFNPDQIPTEKAGGSISVSTQDIAFLIDVSGSMYSAIQNAKDEAARTADIVLNGGGRVALYSYSDIQYGEEVIQYCDFGECNGANLASKLAGIHMMGGGDGPESAIYGAKKVLDDLSWDNGGAIVIFTDAPTHGAPCREVSFGVCKDSDGGVNQNQVIEAAIAKNVKIYVVGSGGGGVYENNYDKLINDTGGSYYASKVAEAFSDIVSKITITKNSCYGNKADDTGAFEKPEEKVTPTPTTETQNEVQETIVGTETNPLQTFDIKFTFSDSDLIRLGIRQIDGSQRVPNVARVPGDASVATSSCSGSTRNLLDCTYPWAYKTGGIDYTSGEFVIYVDRDSFTDDTSAAYYGAGSVIPDFWNYKDLKINIYFYDRIMYSSERRGREHELARYEISSDSVRTLDSNGRYWIIARVYGNPSSSYWVNKMEILNLRTNRDPSSFLP